MTTTTLRLPGRIERLPQLRRIVRGGLAARGSIGAGLAAKAGGAAAWSPTLLTSLSGWWDFSDRATLFKNDAGTDSCEDNDKIAYIVDKSGNAKHASQTNDTYRPTIKAAIQNGLSAANLTTQYNFWIVPSLLCLEIFAVFKITTFSGESINYNQPGILVDGNSTIGGNSNYGGPGYIRTVHWNGSWYVGPQVAASGNTTYLFHDILTPATKLEMQLNGGTIATISDAGFVAGRAVTRMGRTQSWATIRSINGYLMEIIVCGAAQTAANRTACHSYLNSKWAIY